MRVCAICFKNFLPGDGLLFKIPKDPELKADWETVCGKQLLASSLICSDHFPSNVIANIGKKKSVLLTNARPILKLKPADNLKGKRGLVLHEVEFPNKRVAQTHIATVQEKKHEMVAINEFGFSNCQSHKEVQTVTREGLFKCALCRKNCHPANGKYFRIPEDESRRKLWSESCRIQFSPDAVICEDHFSPKSFIRYKNQLTLLPNAVPSPPRLSKKQIEANIASEKIVIDDDNRSETSVNVPFNSSCLLLEDPLNLNEISIMEEENLRKQYVNKEIQTDPNMFGYEKYVHKCRQLETEIKELKLQIMRSNMAMNSLYKIFTEGQIRKLTSPDIHWRDHDMENALELYKAGSRAYNYLYKKGFPLPHTSSLQRWKRKLKKNENKNTNLSVPPNESKEEETNDFSGDDNDWFDDFYEEETVNKDKNSEEKNVAANAEYEIIDKPQQHENLKDIVNENETDRIKRRLDTKEADILNATSQYASPDLNAIIISSNAKVFVAKTSLELNKSKEQKSATNSTSQPEMQDLYCLTPVKNIKETMDGGTGEQGCNENQNAILITEEQLGPLDYNEFLKTIHSGDYLTHET